LPATFENIAREGAHPGRPGKATSCSVTSAARIRIDLVEHQLRREHDGFRSSSAERLERPG